MIQNWYKMIILILLVINSLQKYYRDIAVTMTGFSFIKLTAHIFRYIGQIKNVRILRVSKFWVVRIWGDHVYIKYSDIFIFILITQKIRMIFKMRSQKIWNSTSDVLGYLCAQKLSTEIWNITKHDKNEMNGSILDASHCNVTPQRHTITSSVTF